MSFLFFLALSINSFRSGYHRADRRRKPFGKAEHDRVGARCDLFDINTERDCRIEYPRAVHVDRHLVFETDVPNHLQIVDRNRRSHAVRIFHTDQSRMRIMDFISGADRQFDVGRNQHSVRIIKRPKLYARDHCRRADFVERDMTVFPEDYFVASSGMGQNTKLVSERSARNKDRRFFTDFFLLRELPAG